MPDASNSQDINFQPETKGFSYSSGPAEKKKRLNNIFTLLLLFIIFPLIFFFTFAILNYFNLIPLSQITQKAKVLPKASPTSAPMYDPEANTYNIEGSLYGYNDNVLKVKFHNQIFSFTFNPGQSQFYTIRPTSLEDIGTESADLIQILGFFSDLQKQENIGKKVTVTYTKNKNENIIQTITLTLDK